MAELQIGNRELATVTERADAMVDGALAASQAKSEFLANSNPSN
jgi:hypothetical protein